MHITHLIPLYQHEDGIYALLEDEDEEDFFRDYAETEGKDGQGSAQGIIEQVFGEQPDYPVVIPGSWSERRALTGIQQNDNSKTRVFPNPSSGTIKVELPEKETGDCVVKLFSMHGSQVLISNISGNSGEKEIKLGDLVQGAYLLTLFNSRGELIHKEIIIKE